MPSYTERVDGGVYLGSGEDVLDGLGDLRTNAVTLDQADEEVALTNVVSKSNISRYILGLGPSIEEG